MAFTIVLRELSPVDRLSYMLHDVFGYPFAEIAEIAGSTVDVVKKRASRARQRLRDRDWDAIRQEQRREVDAFLAAARSGEMHDLITLLDPDVTLRADADAIALAASRQAENAPALTPKITGLTPSAMPCPDASMKRSSWSSQGSRRSRIGAKGRRSSRSTC